MNKLLHSGVLLEIIRTCSMYKIEITLQAILKHNVRRPWRQRTLQLGTTDHAHAPFGIGV
ncbi:MAG: hypothetical protein J6W49_00555 [Paludibacteraceae bacterium]|nr:hypothetical protein [Paludibacteraceae bacterium]